MKPKFLIVYLKEIKEALRDRRTLTMLAMFVLMYPMLVGFLLQKQISETLKPKNEGISLTVIHGQQAPTLMGLLAQRNMNVKDSGPLDDAAISELLSRRETVAVLKLHEKYGEQYASMRPAQLELWYDSASDNNGKRQKVEDVLREYSNTVAGARLLAHGVSPVILQPVRVQRYDTATNASRSATMFKSLLAMFLLPAFIFCISTAIDATAGERERRSLEVLIAQPTGPGAIIGGKWLAAASLSVIGLALELGLAHVVLKTLALEELGMSWRVSELTMAGAILVCIPLCLMAASLQIVMAMNAKTFKEAQTTVSLVTLVPFLPLFVVPMLNLPPGLWQYAVPVMANQSLLTELAKGSEVGLLPVVLTAGVPLLLSLLCYGLAVWRLRSEKYVLSV
ncbi:ABC transporter permease [Massilia sp. TS11]|uniref:ABC transporter permease n=1 Tax=Massilia sp. TS11 TaxID=2908003 RepID=UPI001EDA7DA6|nr:ABC transporter permease [Massilia sp. TS11]MCG2585442.1 ABC transporter permease subunit [Massilia sp. TS11]